MAATIITTDHIGYQRFRGVYIGAPTRDEAREALDKYLKSLDVSLRPGAAAYYREDVNELSYEHLRGADKFGFSMRHPLPYSA